MLVSVKFNNILIFNTENEFSMQAKMRARRFLCNVTESAGEHLVKAAILLGPNNSGKTNFVRIIASLKNILLNTPGAKLLPNLFSTKQVCELAVRFTYDDAEYSFSCRYNASTSEYTFESFASVKNERETILLLRDSENNTFQCDNERLANAMQTAGKNNLLIYLLDTKQFPELLMMKDKLTAFASSIDIIDMNNIPIQKTLEMLKQPGDMQRLIVDFVKKADLSLDDFRYTPDEQFAKVNFTLSGVSGMEIPQAREEALNNRSQLLDLYHLESVYHGVHVPSLFFDSTGTKKFASLASYIMQALKEERILIVDELDNSLHFKLTRTILSLFNNELNKHAQIIATVHDIALLDCKKLFRKEQIWFTTKDKEQAYLYSLADFTARKDGVRESTDLMGKYRSGVFGALPEPELFESLLEINNGKA